MLNKQDAFTEQTLKIPSKYDDGASDSQLNQLLHSNDLCSKPSTNVNEQ